MKNYNDTDYAANKHSKGIVYRFATGAEELTLEAFLTAHPNMTEQDYAFWKAFSDTDYETLDNAEHKLTKKNVSLHGLDSTEACAAPSAEAEYTARQDQALFEEVIETRLTIIQARRIRLCVDYKLSSRKIAKLEGVHYRSVQDSLKLARKKIMEILKNLSF